MRHLSKSVIAVLAACALLTFGAPPAHASSGWVNTGTLTINLIPGGITVDLSWASPCYGTSYVNVTPDPGTWGSGGGTFTLDIYEPFTFFGGNYILEATFTGTVLTGLVTTGSWTTGLTFGSITDFGTVIYAAQSATLPERCMASSLRMCSNIGIHFPWSYGSWHGGVNPPSISGTMTMAGPTSGTVAAAGCRPPFSALNGKTATITGLTIGF